MNYPDAGQQPPTLYPPPKRAFPWVPVVLGVVGLLIVLAILGGIKAFRAVNEGSSRATVVGNSFVDNMGQHNYQAAQSLFTTQGQAHTTAGDLKDIETLAEKHHGAFVNHGKPQWFIQNYNGQTSVRLTYPAQFTKNSSTITLTLVQTDEGYQIYGAHYEF